MLWLNTNLKNLKLVLTFQYISISDQPKEGTIKNKSGIKKYDYIMKLSYHILDLLSECKMFFSNMNMNKNC